MYLAAILLNFEYFAFQYQEKDSFDLDYTIN